MTQPLHTAPFAAADSGVRVSIVIPLFNRVDLTRSCWQALCAHTLHDAGAEVVFVDNASSDATPAFLETLPATAPWPVQVVRNAENLGFAVACNQGAQRATGGIVIFLNNDTEVHAGWLAPIMQEFAAHSATGVVGVRLLYPDGSMQHAGVGVNRKGIPFHLHHKVAADDALVVERRVLRMVTGACMAVRREEFLARGGFDAGYRNGHEDVDLCLRYHYAGRDVVYVPQSVVTHHESQSEGRFLHCRYNTDRTLRRWGEALLQDDFAYAFPESQRQVAPVPLRFAFKLPTVTRVPHGEGCHDAVLLAEAMAHTLCLRGHGCELHYRDDWGRDDTAVDVSLVLPERHVYVPKPHTLNVLLVPDARALRHCTSVPVQAYDLVCCHADYAEAFRRLCGPHGVPVEYFSAQDAPETVAGTIEEAVMTLAVSGTPQRYVHDREQREAHTAGRSTTLVSVLMATYERPQWLFAAIRSVLAQTHTAWELIIVNDGGTSVADVVAAFNDERIRYVDAPRRSKGAAVNTAFTLASGEYVAYLDDDDIWYPDHLERALHCLETLPGVRMTYSDTVETVEEPASGQDPERRNGQLNPEHGVCGPAVSRPVKRDQVAFADLLECNHIPGISVVHHHSLFAMAGGMDSTLEVLVDFDFWRRLAMHTEPYHIAHATAEHMLRPETGTSGDGQITNLHAADKRRYLWNHCRILRKPVPESAAADVRLAQKLVCRKVEALFLTAQGDHFAQLGNHARVAAAYRLAARKALHLSRTLLKRQCALWDA